MITVFAPFYDGDFEFAGVVGLDVMIADLHRAIIAMDADIKKEGAYAFLVDQAGRIIDSSNNLNAKMAVLSEDFDITPHIARDILEGQTGVAVSDSKMYYAYAPIRSTGWKLCIKMPQALVLSPLSYIYKNMNLVAIIFLALFIVIHIAVRLAGQKFSEELVVPIRRLSDDVDKISEGDLEHKAEIISDDEIGALANNFNNMTESLRKYIANLAHVTAEKERIGAELNVAKQIQSDLLPKIVPPYLNHEAFDLSATMYPAKEVGGDFYDFFLVDDDHLAL